MSEEEPRFSTPVLETVSRCNSSKSSRRKKQELCELEKLQQILEQKEELIRRKLSLLGSESSSDGDTIQTNDERTASWVRKHNDFVEKRETGRENPEKPTKYNQPAPPTDSVSVTTTSTEKKQKHDDIMMQKFADALQSSFSKALISTKTPPLPAFDGDPREWLQFKASFEEGAKRNLSDTENLQRLRLALKGNAKTAVASLLHSCSSPQRVIEALQLRFGNPKRILRSQIAEIRNLRVVGGNDPEELSVFASTLTNCVTTIEALDYGDYLSDSALYDMCMSKLSNQLRSKFLQFADMNVSKNRCVLLCLSDFVRKEAELAQKFIPDSAYLRQGSCNASAPQASQAAPQVGPKKYTVHVASGKLACSFCGNNDHTVTKCEKFHKLTVNERYDWVKLNKKCFRCLIYSHPAKNCKISKYLHRLLKTPKNENPTNSNESIDSNENIDSNVNVNSISMPVTAAAESKLGSLLKVVPVTVLGPKGTVQSYALLDEGASISLMDSTLAEKVGASGVSTSLNIHGIGSLQKTFDSELVQVTLKNSVGATYEVNFRTMPNINLSSQFLSKEKLITYPHIDSMKHLIHWYEVGIPQMIIGQDYWHLIVTRQLHSGKINEPVVSNTLLGFVIHGCVEQVRPSVLTHTIIAHVRANEDDELRNLIKESFQLDSLGLEPKPRFNPEVDRSLELLNKNTKRIDNGCSWETGLLWAKDDNVFPNSDDKAVKRFYSLEKSFAKKPDLAKSYSTQMNRLFEQGFAEEYKGQDSSSDKGWVLSHFAVLNPNKPGKVRLVFDCADKVNGKSLNDFLMTGPDLLQSLLGVLWRFRRAPVALAADIKDMFLKIKIKKEDQEFQKFYWREADDPLPPKLYVMTSMLFGAKCSPSSAIFVKNRNTQDFIDEKPEAVMAVQQNHYCDDYLDSFYSEKEAIQMAKDVTDIHLKGNFEICNWSSNSEAVLQSVDEKKRASGSIQLASSRTLGMIWHPSSDTLCLPIEALLKRTPTDILSGNKIVTKRQMLKILMSVYDPLGLFAFFVIRGRILLQEVWRSEINWDCQLKENEHAKWVQWLEDLQVVKECSIPRCYMTHPADIKTIQLHTFCDASNKAYAAACYLRYECEDEVQVALVAAKARVTPLKPCSIPRLELQAAVLGARLAHTVSKELQLPIQEKYYWSDSRTTLSWIQSDPKDFKPFVGHRLAAIDDLSAASQWRWVPTAFNPADIATRDGSKLDMSIDGPWFSGPSYLKKKEEEWPEEKIKTAPEKETKSELKQVIHVIKIKENYLPDVNRFSSWKCLVTATAYILLFINKCRKSGDRRLTLQLLGAAEKLWIKKTQEEEFSRELKCLKNKESLPSDSKLIQLTPVLNEDNIMVLGGRIDRTPNVPQEMKRPIILSGKSYYTKLLIHHYHKQHNHASTETVVNEIRQKYWILKLRSTVRSVAHNCQHCKIQRATAVQPPMGDLPLPRLQHHKRPFSYCGLDYFGPMEVSIGRRREKRWGALFTCLVTRAVHMEIAASLNADSVIMAIRRMSTRRGWPTAMYSDNGTNFKGADGELKKAFSQLDKDAIANDMLNRGIKWHYIPATAAHMGGAWERLVQSIKKALKATLHERAPKEETLSTLITEAEQSANSRPLTFVSVDPRDPEALTPYHFLLGSSSVAPIPGTFDNKDLMLRKQWKVAQRLADMFWSRWIREYLPTLLDRKMKNTADQTIKEGQLVIIVDHNSPRNVWLRGIITKIFPGQDETIRVVEVRTSSGTFRRPVNKVIILPVSKDDDDETGDAADCLFLSRLLDMERRDRDGVGDNRAFHSLI